MWSEIWSVFDEYLTVMKKIPVNFLIALNEIILLKIELTDYLSESLVETIIN